MARFKLTAPHYIDGHSLPAGTEIGEGTDFPFSGRPSASMVGVDDEGKKAVEARLKTYIDPDRGLPTKMENK